MNIPQHPDQAQTYRNVMESLVIDEVEAQFSHLSERVTHYLNKTEVIAYALNRLPPLYATSEKGWQQQKAKAGKDMKQQIMTAVRQAIAAVQRDPLRSSAPLKVDEDRDSQEALQSLKDLLQREELSWHNLVDVVESALIRATHGEVSWQREYPRPEKKPRQSYMWLDNRFHL